MLRRTLLVLPTTLGLLFASALPAEAQACNERAWRWDGLQHRWVRSAPAEPCAPHERVVTVGAVRTDEGPYVNPRAPRAWQPAPATTTCTPARPDRAVVVPAAPPPVVVRVVDERGVVQRVEEPGLPVAEPVPCAPPAPRACEPRWRPTQAPQPQPARYIPREWRSALPAEALLDAHRRVREAADAAARRAVIAEVSRQWTVTVDQVITLAGALPTAAERLEALTALHAATTDASAYDRTYRLLPYDDQCTLHVRITRTYDAATAAQNERLQRLMREERELQRVLGDE